MRYVGQKVVQLVAVLLYPFAGQDQPVTTGGKFAGLADLVRAATTTAVGLSASGRPGTMEEWLVPTARMAVTSRHPARPLASASR